MSSKSESSNSNVGSIRGIPAKCSCGMRVKVYTSNTSVNPGRPFVRCESMNKKGHFFKWVDEALLEEFEDAKGAAMDVKDNSDVYEKLRHDVDVNIFEIWELNQQVKQMKKEMKIMKYVLAIFGMAGAMYMASKLV